MREVSRDQFYEEISKGDVVSSIPNSKWPYTQEFHMRASRYNVVGRIVGELDDKHGIFDVKRYYLA